jgi:hypothetical protein
MLAAGYRATGNNASAHREGYLIASQGYRASAEGQRFETPIKFPANGFTKRYILLLLLKPCAFDKTAFKASLYTGFNVNTAGVTTPKEKQRDSC